MHGPCSRQTLLIRAAETAFEVDWWLQGHGTVRTLEAVEVAGEHPAQECLISECGELPADTDLTVLITYPIEVTHPAATSHARGVDLSTNQQF